MSGHRRNDQEKMNYNNHRIYFPHHINEHQNYRYSNKKYYNDDGYSNNISDSSKHTNGYPGSSPSNKYSRRPFYGSSDLQYNNNNAHPKHTQGKENDIDMRQSSNLKINENEDFDERRSVSVPPKSSKPNADKIPVSTTSDLKNTYDIEKPAATSLVPQPKNEPNKPKEILVSNTKPSCSIQRSPKSSKTKEFSSNSKGFESNNKSSQSKHYGSSSNKNESLSKSSNGKDHNPPKKVSETFPKPDGISHKSSKNNDSYSNASNSSKKKDLNLNSKKKIESPQNESIHKYMNVQESPSNYDKCEELTPQSKHYESVSKSSTKKLPQNSKTMKTYSKTEIKPMSSIKSNINNAMAPGVDDAEKTPNPSVFKCEYILGACKFNSKENGTTVKKSHNDVIISPTFVSLQTDTKPVDNVQSKPLVRKRNCDSLSNSASKKHKKNHDTKDTGTNNWKMIGDIDDKITLNNKVKKAQRKLVKKLMTDYKLELGKLKEYKTLNKTLLIERNKLLNELQKGVVESSDEDDDDEEESDDEDDDDDDVEIVETTDFIELFSSSESESEAVVNIEEINKTTTDTISLIMPDKMLNGPHSTSQTAADIIGKLLFTGPMGEVEPKLDTIFVSKQENTFVSDIKVFSDRLFLACSHGILRQYDMKSQECVQHYIGHSQLIHSIFLTVYPFNSRRLFSGGYDNNILIHDIATANVLDSVRTKSPIMSICEGNNNVYYGCSDGLVGVYSLDKNCRLKDFNTTDSGLVCITGLKDPTKSLLFVGSANGDLTMWDTSVGTKLKNISVQDHKGVPIGFITLPQQRLLVYSKNNIHFLYYASDKVPVTFNNCTKNNSLCITKNYIIVGNTLGTIYVHRIKGSTIHKIPIVTFMNSSSPILTITFYNNTIISGDKTGHVYFNRLIEK